jgi:hypothetical protein
MLRSRLRPLGLGSRFRPSRLGSRFRPSGLGSGFRPLGLGRLVPVLLAAAIALASTAALLARPATGDPGGTVDYVLIAGVPGLRWEDVSEQTTPTLWRMAESGSIGSLSVRSARRPTCPTDGWLTLGAGNYAAWNAETGGDGCPPTAVDIQRPDALGAYLPDQRTVVPHNRDTLAWGAVPGALAESVRCTVAVGPGAAVAAARPFGRVDRYEPTLPADPARLFASCVLSIVDLGTVAGDDPAARAAAARRADAELARVLAARPERSVVLVAGVSDTDRDARLHVAVADGPGWDRGWLTSASTGRDGYLQLVDLAPTALAALGRPAPTSLFAGLPASGVPGRPADLRAAVTGPADADREAGAQRRVSAQFFGALAAVQVLLFLGVVPLLRRARRHAGPTGPGAAPPRLVAAVEVFLVGAALAIPAALVTDAVPWWRSARAGLLFAGLLLGVLTVATVTVVLGRPYRRTLGPMGMVAGLAAIAVAADVLTGARLQLNGVAGYSVLEGGRYAGLGTVGLGVFIAGALLAAGCLAQQVHLRWRPLVVVLVGAIAVVLVGSPYLGADAGGAVALTAGVCVAAAISKGGWLTFARLAWATLAGLAVTAGFAALDMRRPPEQRGSLGRFLSQLSEGTGGLSVHRTGVANVVAFGTSPLTTLAVAAAAFVWFALLRDWGGLKRLFGLNPAVRAAMAGTAVATVIAGVLGGAALNVAGAAAATAVPMAALAALRVLGHAADRTPAPIALAEAAAAPPSRAATDVAAPAGGAAGNGPPGDSAPAGRPPGDGGEVAPGAEAMPGVEVAPGVEAAPENAGPDRATLRAQPRPLNITPPRAAERP